MSPVETIGIDLGGTKMLSGVVDEECNVIHVSREHSTGQTEDELLDLAEREIREALEARPDAAAIGIGVPCTIDRERGVAVLAVNLPITDVPIRDILAERIGLPVFLDNDANAAMLAEHLFGAAKGARNALMLTVGTGIGGGLLIGGEIYRGTQGGGAELGHTVIDVNGPKCQGACPNHGCIESRRLGYRARARGQGGRRAGAGLGAGPAAREGARGRRQGGDDGGDRRRRCRGRRHRADRRPPRDRACQLRQRLRAGGDGDRRRCHRRGRPAARARPARGAAPGLCRR